jgi:hypothetical protein
MKKYLLRCNKKIFWWVGSILLIVPAIVNAYFLMPFPGSQDTESISLCYYLEKIIPPTRIIGTLFLGGPVLYVFAYGAMRRKIFDVVWCLIIIALYFFTDSVYSAREMFKEPVIKKFENVSLNKVPINYLIVGIENNGEAKAYPVNYIGYHHKVQDNVGGMPVLVTYCTMCRTGRVYSPLVQGKYQNFRLVGARHYNAVIEDCDTKTWWYQATGQAAVGPLIGESLNVIPFEQMTLRSWLKKFPESLILQADSIFFEQYSEISDYDRKRKTDSNLSWQRKSWVIGIIIKNNARAYEWNDILKCKLINDTIAHEPIVLFLENDNFSFHVWSAKVGDKQLSFNADTSQNVFRDLTTHSLWNSNGECIEGFYKGEKLNLIQSYQEYWYSWKYFHKNVTTWKNEFAN